MGKKNQNKTIYLTLIILGLVIILTVIASLYIRSITTDITLYPKLNWERIPSSNPESFNQTLKGSLAYWNNNPVKQLSPKSSEWVSSQKNITMDQAQKTERGFEQYYNSISTQEGWLRDYSYKGKSLTPISADGPTGSIWGYLKISKDKTKIILLQETIKFKGNTSGPPTCPCDLTLHVYMSDPFSLLEIGN